ncbi:MAG: hypothetical protein FGF50_07420 [Candidatus Brockarchaeota archaeon]|nr:hypothetical protein [Candidatus Brockarchaeota archaeon]
MKKDTMSHWFRELVKVDEADTRSGYHSNCWKVSPSRLIDASLLMASGIHQHWGSRFTGGCGDS